MEITGEANGLQEDEGRMLTEDQLEQQRMLAMRAWDLRERRRTHHPVYRSRRTADGKALMQHVLGSLLVLAALMLISKG